LLSIALRVLTLLEFVARRQLTAEGVTLSGLYAGNPKLAVSLGPRRWLTKSLADGKGMGMFVALFDGPHD
jgi:hypothetical protein